MNVESWPINFGDITIIVILLLSGLLAFARGFVKEVLSIASWIGAAAVTFQAFPYAAPLVMDVIDAELVANFVTGMSIFIVTLIALSVGSHYLARAVRGSTLSMLDRSLGFVFGLLRGALLVSLAYLLFILVVPDEDDQPDWMRQAKARPLVEQGADILRTLVPDDAIGDGLDQFGEAVKRLEGLGAGRTLEELSRLDPAPNPDAPEGEEGYNRDARDQMDQLVDVAR
ncbi:MAG: CvpA family protein [Alphaproteobacteria bacterium]